jgi:hypothetical protein
MSGTRLSVSWAYGDVVLNLTVSPQSFLKKAAKFAQRRHKGPRKFQSLAQTVSRISCWHVEHL